MSPVNVNEITTGKVRISVYLPPRTVTRLREMRVATGQYVSDIILDAVDRYLDPPTPLHIAAPTDGDYVGAS